MTGAGCAAPLRGITPIATLERFVVYRSCEQNISAAPSGAAQRARGIARAVTGSMVSKAQLATVTACRDSERKWESQAQADSIGH